jgi:hypothetical protein
VRSAASARTTAIDQPPLLGKLTSALLGRPVTARCAAQQEPAREQPAGVMRLSKSVCQVLVGYAVAEPWAPKANTAAGLEVAENALGYLRGISRAGLAPRVDCRAVGFLYRTLRGLGATQGQAVALRNMLLRARSRVSPPLSLPAAAPSASAPSSNRAQLLGGEHQARGRTRPQRRPVACARSRVDSRAA